VLPGRYDILGLLAANTSTLYLHLVDKVVRFWQRCVFCEAGTRRGSTARWSRYLSVPAAAAALLGGPLSSPWFPAAAILFSNSCSALSDMRRPGVCFNGSKRRGSVGWLACGPFFSPSLFSQWIAATHLRSDGRRSMDSAKRNGFMGL